MKRHNTTNQLAFGIFCVLALLILIALPRLPLPLEVDQALFYTGALALLDGARYYVDFWDWKAPGIYWFFATAMRLFGQSEIAIHLLELIWCLALALMLIFTLRRRLTHWSLALAAPLFAVGVYLLRPAPWYATQVEYIIGLPLFACLILLCVDYSSKHTRTFGFFAAGMAAACATVFKPLYAPIAVAMWLARVGQLIANTGWQTSRVIAQQAVPFALGVIVIWGMVGGWFYYLGTFTEFFVSVFIAPLESFSRGMQRPYGRIVSMLYFAAIVFGLLLPWLIVAVSKAFSNPRKTDAICLLAMVWIIVGYPVVMSQSFSWWRYHMQLFYIPVAVVAAFGIDLAMPWLMQTFKVRAKTIIMVIVLVTLLPHMPLWLSNVWWWKSVIGVHDGSERIQSSAVSLYQKQYNRHAQISCDVAFLHNSDAAIGPIFVFGTPQYLVLAERAQAIPVRGTSVRTLPTRMWTKLSTQLIAARPPYVFVSQDNAPVVQAQAPAVMQWLASEYHSFTNPDCAGDKGDRWYSLKKKS